MSDGPHHPRGACVICDLLTGALPATFVHRDERCAAFMDIQPVNPGHLLVVSNEHVPLLGDLEADTAAHLMRIAHRLTIALRASGIRCEGVNLFLADGEAAMQEVPHAHLHVFPRWRGDGFGLKFGPDYVKRPRRELEETAAAIRTALGASAHDA
jgi:histidine triad (HIT) family protein